MATGNTGKGKKLVYVSENLLDEAAKVSRAEGVSLSKLVEGAVSEAIKINELGFSSKQMADFFNVMQAHRVLGGLFVPSGVLDFMIENCYKNNSSGLEALWYETGKWNGRYLKEKFVNPVDAFHSFLELSRWDLNEVDVQNEGNELKVRCISTVMSVEGTKLLAKYIEGVVNGLDYRTQALDVMKGMIILRSIQRV